MNAQDLKQIQEHGSSIEAVESQINTFQQGSKFINLYKAATKPDDIIDISSLHTEHTDNKQYKLYSFIPASGAASRMFKSLFETLDRINSNADYVLPDDGTFQSPAYFFSHLKELALCHSLQQALEKDGLNLDWLLGNKDYKTILEYLLTDKGLNFGNTPKALIEFHHDTDGYHYAFEEHISEAINYTDNKNVYLHYTLSPEHIDRFLEAAKKVIPEFESKYGCKIHISTSIQSPSTDTIAVNPDNTLFRNDDGSILFRPGGHGSLIYNLNNIDSDIILIKNIDNVVPQSKRDTIVECRSKFISHIKYLFEKRNDILREISTGSEDDKLFDEAVTFMKNELNLNISQDFKKLAKSDKTNIIKEMLDRPIRICGMVKNSGEPGGGPFIVKDEKGNLSKQIVESSQINHNDEQQEKIFRSSTHFNPVDIVCMTKDLNGNRYDLTKYIDKATSFISNKSKNGKPIKVLELPGLWNGAMSGWITLFVEVPAETFNPVKTVNDLFRPMHIA